MGDRSRSGSFGFAVETLGLYDPLQKNQTLKRTRNLRASTVPLCFVFGFAKPFLFHLVGCPRTF